MAATGNDHAAPAAPATPTKMELATDIYKRMRGVKGVTRKDVVEQFIVEVGLTRTGPHKLIKDEHKPTGKK